MNLQLINPFAQNFPERVDASLDTSAQCVSFNGYGTSRYAGSLVAVGRSDGGVAVVDLDTRGYLRFLEGHVKGVTSVCWSRNSRYLLSASRDWNAIVWDVESGDRRNTIRFDAPVTSAVFHPRNSKIVLVTIQNQAEAVLVDLRSGSGARWDLDITQAGQQLENTQQEHGLQGQTSKAEATKKRREYATVARFNRRGDLIFIGSSTGNIHVFDTQTQQLVLTEAISPGSSIKGFEFDRTGSSLVVNSNDRCVRVFDINELAYYSLGVTECRALLTSATSTVNPSGSLNPSKPQARSHRERSASSLNGGTGGGGERDTANGGESLLKLAHRFQDLVNRTPWNVVKFSNDGEYIVGGAGHKAAHQIYIWDRANGALSRILEGPKDCLDDLDWHPIRPIVASASDQGLLHIWVTTVTERYSAYASRFEELEENLEYQEREDEFDIEDETIVAARKLNTQEVNVDIVSVEKLASPKDASALLSNLQQQQQQGQSHTVSVSSSSMASAVDHDLAVVKLAEYLRSSDDWADEDPDDDDREDFSPSLDVDAGDSEFDDVVHVVQEQNPSFSRR